jgi:DNA-directed RNA polymerase subunit M/transcription elongation factor TFIIS
MKFCDQCDNMMYMKINDENKNKLNYYCRSCGFEDTTLTEQGFCVLDTQIQKKEQKFNHIVNKYTKLDPTLPRVYNMKCPCETCKTNTEKASEPTEIIYMRYDDDNLKYIYICPSCDYYWTS